MDCLEKNRNSIISVINKLKGSVKPWENKGNMIARSNSYFASVESKYEMKLGGLRFINAVNTEHEIFYVEILVWFWFSDR